jgi:hypothetical protein
MGLPRVEEKAQTGDDLRHWKRYRWEPARMDGWQWLKIVASVVVIVLFCLVAVTPFVSELVGSYWPGRFSR